MSPYTFSNSSSSSKLLQKIPNALFTDLLETLEEEVLGPQLVEPDGVDDEDGVVEDVLEAGEGNQHLPVQNWNMLWNEALLLGPILYFNSAV